MGREDSHGIATDDTTLIRDSLCSVAQTFLFLSNAFMSSSSPPASSSSSVLVA